jgi:hypothetical protein
MAGKLVAVEVSIELLKARVIVYVGCERKFIRKMKKQGVDLAERDALATTWFHREAGDPLPFHVLIHSKSAAMSVIAHEAVHASSFILEAVGVIADWENDEVQAYLVGLLCEKVEAMLWPPD